MPTRIPWSTLLTQAGDRDSDDPTHGIHFMVPVQDRIMRITTWNNDVQNWTLTALGRTEDGCYTQCTICGRTPLRRYYICAKMRWSQSRDEYEDETVEVACQSCTNDRIDHRFLNEQTTRVRQEGQRRRLIATRPRPGSRHFAPGTVRFPPDPPAPNLVEVLVESLQQQEVLRQIGESVGGVGDAARNLTGAQTNLNTAFTATHNCEYNDLPQIPNGIYTYDDANGGTWRFCIYTIRNSASNPELNGCRVMRRIPPNEQHWRAFAFLRSDGTLQVWQRYRRQTEQEWYQAAEYVLGLLNGNYPLTEVRTVGSDSSLWRAGRNWLHTGDATLVNSRSNITINMWCRVCNEAVGSRWPHGLCTYHWSEQVQEEREQQREIIREQHNRDLSTAAQRQPAPRFRPRPVGPLALDELGHGEIL